MAWAKLHTDILGDPKLMRAARKGARELLYLPWLIAFAKGADDDGRLTVGGEPADAVDISDLIPGATPKAVTTSLSSLVSIGVLVGDPDGALRFVRWQVRSATKPSDSPSAIAGRVTKHRAKMREENGNAEHETSDAEASNALHETPGNALHETPGNATEEKRGEERRGEEKRGETSSSADASEFDAQQALLNCLPPSVRAAWTAELSVATDGMHGPALTPAQIQLACREYLGDGHLDSPKLVHFRAYLRSAALAPVASVRTARAAAPPKEAGEAGRIFAAIRALTKEQQVPGRGPIRTISKIAVASLGERALTAYEQVGGADRFLDNEKIGFLLRDFEKAYRAVSQIPTDLAS